MTSTQVTIDGNDPSTVVGDSLLVNLTGTSGGKLTSSATPSRFTRSAI